MTPEEIILRKNLVLHGGLSSDDWSRVSAALRDRAFFSSRVESARFLATCRDRLAQLLAQTADPSPDSPLPSRAQLVSDIMSAARQTGIATGKGGLTDPSSPRRANVIIDTNAGLAAAYCRAELANSYGARLAFPAQELVRIEERNAKRDWRKRWLANGGKLYAGRMIALKSDPVWVKISRFNQPYPPFDFGSGMGTEDVSREEALALGVIKEDYTPPKSSPLTDFNATLEADLNFKNDDIWQSLKAIFGDQIRQQDGKISWRNDLIREAFTANKPFAIRLGSPTPNLLSKLPNSIPPNLVKDKPLTITQKWLSHKREDGGTHRDHFYPNETDERNIPLTIEDLEIMPSIWREPDMVDTKTANKNRIRLSQKALDGGIYRLVVDLNPKGAPHVVTFYKNKASTES